MDVRCHCDQRHTWMLGAVHTNELGAGGVRSRFSIATMSINVIGSFLMGFLFIVTLERLTLSPALRTGILTGVLGGYTTFSTFEMETLLLAEGGELLKAALYAVLSVGLGFVAAFGGAYIARNL